ncbi:MAG: DUF4416 family protein [Candidatus Brocadiae bacterium]|nr:DUF4416 family protein [Candidatus Brocadiia bacterium]
MPNVAPPPLYGLICGLLAGVAGDLGAARAELESAWGPVLIASDPRPWEESRYYEKDMGPALLRQFLGFKRPVLVQQLPALKHQAVALEARLALGATRPRPVNIDPGILDACALTLASTKRAGHRSWMEGEIWADITLIWQKGGFLPLPWTYADFRDPRTLAFLTAFRRAILPALNPQAKK